MPDSVTEADSNDILRGPFFHLHNEDVAVAQQQPLTGTESQAMIPVCDYLYLILDVLILRDLDAVHQLR